MWSLRQLDYLCTPASGERILIHIIIFFEKNKRRKRNYKSCIVQALRRWHGSVNIQMPPNCCFLYCKCLVSKQKECPDSPDGFHSRSTANMCCFLQGKQSIIFVFMSLLFEFFISLSLSTCSSNM